MCRSRLPLLGQQNVVPILLDFHDVFVRGIFAAYDFEDDQANTSAGNLPQSRQEKVSVKPAPHPTFAPRQNFHLLPSLGVGACVKAEGLFLRCVGFCVLVRVDVFKAAIVNVLDST